VRDGADVVVRFSPKGGQSSVLTLRPWARPAGQASWSRTARPAGDRRARAAPGSARLRIARARALCLAGRPRAVVSRPAAIRRRSCSTKGKKGKALKAAKAKCAAAPKKGGGKGKASALKKGKGGKASKATAARKGKATAGKGRLPPKRRLRDARAFRASFRSRAAAIAAVGIGIGAGRAVAPDRTGPGRIVLAPADDMDMQLGGDIAEGADVQLVDRQAHRRADRAHRRFRPDDLLHQLDAMGGVSSSISRRPGWRGIRTSHG
jgi:hypothetical protein